MTQTLRFAIEAAPLEAGKRIRFHGFGRSNYRSREMGEALRVFERALILHLLYPTTGTGLPAQPDLGKSPRLQFLDTGLLNFAAGLQQALFMMQDLHGVHQAILAEHLVAQELIARDAQVSQKPAFWVRESKGSTAEVDFVLPFRDTAFPPSVRRPGRSSLGGAPLLRPPAPGRRPHAAGQGLSAPPPAVLPGWTDRTVPALAGGVIQDSHGEQHRIVESAPGFFASGKRQPGQGENRRSRIPVRFTGAPRGAHAGA